MSPLASEQPTFVRGPVFHEVQWNADVQSIAMRKLINETHSK